MQRALPVRGAKLPVLGCACVHRQRPLPSVSAKPAAQAMFRLNVPISALRISGEVCRSTRIGDTGQPVENGFCGECGSACSAIRPLLLGD